jgi:hypothetical protein
LFDRPLPDKSLQRLVDRFGQREHLKGHRGLQRQRCRACCHFGGSAPISIRARPPPLTPHCAIPAMANSCPSTTCPMLTLRPAAAPQRADRRASCSWSTKLATSTLSSLALYEIPSSPRLFRLCSSLSSP